MRPALRAAAVAGLLLNATVWGLSWWPFRHLQGLGLPPLWATAAMYVIGGTLIAAAQPRALRQLLAQPALWSIAVTAGATNAAFNWGVTSGDVVRVVLLFYLMPVWAALLAWALLGERLHAGGAARLALALIGAAIVLWPAEGGLPLPRSLPDWLGLTGGMFFALNNVLLRKFAAAPAAARGLAMFAGGAVVPAALGAALVGMGAAGWPAAASVAHWAPLVALLALAFLAANFGLQFGAGALPSHLTAVIMTTEIVIAGVSSVLIGGEPLTARLLLGGALIVGAALL